MSCSIRWSRARRTGTAKSRRRARGSGPGSATAQHEAAVRAAEVLCDAGRVRRWLEKNHRSADELLVGFYRKESGRPSITWPESVDQALCFGWIDGVRRSIDDVSYSIRFSPRTERSNWSAVNIARARELIEAGLMEPAGVAAFERRDRSKDGTYSYERASAELPPDYARRLEANERAHAFFQAQPPGYRRTATLYVISAQKEATRLKRLQQLIDDSAAGLRIGPLRRS